MARILVVVPWARYTPHFETDLELIQRHVHSGDDVHVAVCDGDLPACDRNPAHEPVRCEMCMGRRRQGLALVDGNFVSLPLLMLRDTDQAELRAMTTRFSTLEELRSVAVEGFDLGMAVLSSLISFRREPAPSVVANAAWIENLLLAALAVYRSIGNRLRAQRYDRVYVFNGRFAIARAVLRACQAAGVVCATHERGHDHRHFALFENALCHDAALMHRTMLECWQRADEAEREAVGAQFFEDRAKGVGKNWFSFVDKQANGLLPEDFDPTQKNLVVFVSSEDEFAAIGREWDDGIYATQVEGVRRIVDDLVLEDRIHVTLRVHPNLSGIDNDQTRAIAQLDSPMLTIVPAQSAVSSYALLAAANQVLTFGSTMGIEAVYWGVPSILAGPSFYRALGATYTPSTHGELMALIRSDLEANPRLAALIYGYHWNTFGEPFRYYAAHGVFAGTFQGSRVRPGLAALMRAGLLSGLRPFGLVRARAVRRSRTALLGSRAYGATEVPE